MFRDNMREPEKKYAMSEDDRKAIGGILGRGQGIPMDYDQFTKRKRENAILRREGDLRKFLDSCLNYYDKTYPDSPKAIDYIGPKVKLVIKGDHIDQILEIMSEEELLGVQRILDYCDLENRFGKRHILDICDHDRMNVVSAKLKQYIPRAMDRINLERMERDKSLIEKQKDILKAEIAKAQVDFAEMQKAKEFSRDKLKDLTIVQLRELLEARDIEYSSKDNKQALMVLLTPKGGLIPEPEPEILTYKPSIEDMTVKDIKELLDKRGVSYTSKMRKKQLIALIPFKKPEDKEPKPDILKQKPGLARYKIEDLKELLDAQGIKYKDDESQLELIKKLG
jgi:hypothetical protein